MHVKNIQIHEKNHCVEFFLFVFIRFSNMNSTLLYGNTEIYLPGLMKSCSNSLR